MSTTNDQTDPKDQPILRGELDALLANNATLQVTRREETNNDRTGATIEVHVQEHTPRRQEHTAKRDREETEQMHLGGRKEDPNLLSNNAHILQAMNIVPLEDPPVDRRGVEEDVPIGYATNDETVAPPIELVAIGHATNDEAAARGELDAPDSDTEGLSDGSETDASGSYVSET